MDHGATGPWPVAQPCRFDPVSSSERPGTCPPAMHRSGRRREAGPERNRRHGPALSGRQRRLRHERAHAPGRRPAGTVVSGCRHGHRRLARHRPEGLPLPAVVHPDGHRRAQFRLRAADRRPSHPALLRLHELPGRLPDDHGRHRRRQTAGQKRCRVGAHGRLRDHGSRAGQRRGAPALARPVRLLVHRLTGSPARRRRSTPRNRPWAYRSRRRSRRPAASTTWRTRPRSPPTASTTSNTFFISPVPRLPTTRPICRGW